MTPSTLRELEDACVPRRYWRLPESPFNAYPRPLGWWDGREAFAAAGLGMVVFDDGRDCLPSAVEVFKRLLADPECPAPTGGPAYPLLYLEAADLCRGDFRAQDEVVTNAGDAAYLLVANAGASGVRREGDVLRTLLLARHGRGQVTFLHVVDWDVIERIVQAAPLTRFFGVIDVPALGTDDPDPTGD